MRSDGMLSYEFSEESGKGGVSRRQSFYGESDMTAEFRKAARQVGEAEWTPLYKEKRGKQEATEGQVTPKYGGTT